MRIIEMTATFGRLDHATLRPGAGFTLIQAPNESGKSTWCAFLRAMLYGFPARDRNSGGYLAEKNRYQPWSGAAMEGSLTLEWQGRELTLYRGPKGSVPWGAFSATWTSTREPVEGLTAETCGETLLGVSREVFERTAFVGQGSVFLSPSADLEKRIAALSTSGEEEVSFSQVERRLKDWLNRRRVNVRVGLLPELDEELSRTQAALDRQGALLRQTQAARQTKEALSLRQGQLEEQLKAHTQSEKAQQAQRRREARAEYENLSAQAAVLEKATQALPPADTLRQAQGDLSYHNTLTANLRVAENSLSQAEQTATEAELAARSAPLFGGMEPGQAAQQAQRIGGEMKALEKKLPAPLSLVGAPVGAALGILLSRVWTGQALGSIPVILLGLVLGWALVALPLFLMEKRRKEALSALLDKYGGRGPEELTEASVRYAQTVAAAREARRHVQTVEAERDKAAAQAEELKEQLLELVHPFAPEVTDLFGVSAALSRALQQREALSVAQAKAEAAGKLLAALPDPGPQEPEPVSLTSLSGDPTQLAAQLAAVRGELSRASDDASRLLGELHSLGDPAELEAKKGALLEEIELRQGEYDAIAAALEGLKAADAQLRERFSPAVNRLAGEYLSALTGGRYDSASLTRQFQALAQEPGGMAPRQDLSLSAGAAQQLYLAVRLAMCDLALPQAEPCPVLLDDALDAFDDQRAKLALDCLLDLAKKRQVLLFSCHSREKELLEGTTAQVLNL